MASTSATTTTTDHLSEYITLISSDNFTFIIRRSAANISGAIKRMLDPANGFRESKEGICRFDNINSLVLEKVCEYLYYNEKHQQSGGGGGKDGGVVPDMEIPPELCLELLMAADYLNV